MMNVKNSISYRIMVLCAGLLFATSVCALELDAAKSQGLVGERADGYLGVVIENPAPEVQQLIADVNGKRRARYETIAERNSITMTEVEARAGQKAIEMTVSGGWVYRGKWAKK